ncbi:MAG: hypothetical protein ACI97A_003401 [Planctomycetota bacterium]|jgi:hypothetical protein
MMQQNEIEGVNAYVTQLNGRVWGMALGLLTGFGLFIATMWLVVKGGDDVGQHLSLLSQYFPGYDVTFFGACFGFLWGCFLGYAFGRAICLFYNFAAKRA